MDRIAASMHVLYLALSLSSALAFYLASPHQRLWPRATTRRAVARGVGWIAAGLGAAAAIAALGPIAGSFSALTAWMGGTVALPYLDAWRQARKAAAHVG